jgi:hypothetical protein
MKKMEFQRFAATRTVEYFHKLYAERKITKYTVEAKNDRVKVVYYPGGFNARLYIYFYKSGKVMFFQNDIHNSKKEDVFYEWSEGFDFKDVVSVLIKEVEEYMRIESEAEELEPLDYEFNYEASKFKKAQAQ